MSDDDDIFFPFDDFDEDIGLAELIVGHKEKKLFPDWLSIAFARQGLERQALAKAGFDQDDARPMYRRNPAYKAAIEKLKQRFPGLLTYQPTICEDLDWLADHASEIAHWHEKLPVDIQTKLTSPNIIRKRYEPSESKT